MTKATYVGGLERESGGQFDFEAECAVLVWAVRLNDAKNLNIRAELRMFDATYQSLDRTLPLKDVIVDCLDFNTLYSSINVEWNDCA